MIITIDGYAGSGKTTAASQLAHALHFELMNTGAMYRATAYALMQAGFDIYQDTRDTAAIAAHIADFRFELHEKIVKLNDVDLWDQVATEEMGKAASRVGTFPEVRARLKQEQRRLAEGKDVICEGRDQGTAVFPDAAVKFFFRASAEVRALRRVAQLKARGLSADFDAICRQIQDRDHQDENRSIDPLYRAADAHEIDTTNKSEAAVLAEMLEKVERQHKKSC